MFSSAVLSKTPIKFHHIPLQSANLIDLDYGPMMVSNNFAFPGWICPASHSLHWNLWRFPMWILNYLLCWVKKSQRSQANIYLTFCSSSSLSVSSSISSVLDSSLTIKIKTINLHDVRFTNYQLPSLSI